MDRHVATPAAAAAPKAALWPGAAGPAAPGPIYLPHVLPQLTKAMQCRLSSLQTLTQRGRQP